MGFVSPRMSLKVWNTGSDPYDHEQLADNWLKLDQHDHSQGRGTPIGSDGIREGAITSVHIYPGAIGADAIGQGAVGTDKIADEAVTWEKLDPHVRMPIGAVLDWYWPQPSEWENVLAEGWVVCMGQQLEADEHDFPAPYKGQRYNVPNLIGHVIMGADPEKAVGTNSLVGSALDTLVNPNGTSSGTSKQRADAVASLGPGVLGVGGSNNNRAHHHGVPGHHHSATGLAIAGSGTHTHGVSGSANGNGPWNLPPHSHEMAQDGLGNPNAGGDHSAARNVMTVIPADEKTPPNFGTPYNTRYGLSETLQYQMRALAVTGGVWSGTHGVAGGLESTPYHGHSWSGSVDGGGAGGGHSHTLSGSIGLTAGSDGDATFNSNDTSIDPRMAHVGLLKIMKVRNC